RFVFYGACCTAGFLNEGQVLLERLAKKPVARADLEKTIVEALDGHLCRCTGYIKYHEAVRAVILADPGRYLSLVFAGCNCGKSRSRLRRLCPGMSQEGGEHAVRMPSRTARLRALRASKAFRR